MRADVVNCLHCNVPMRFLGEQQIQLGKTGWFLGDLSNLLAGALDVKIFACPKCGKLEFFSAEDSQKQGEEGRKVCPECGAEHDADAECCPICGHVYTK